MITLRIPGQPVGKGRPRVTRNGTYTPKKTKDYQKLVAAIAERDAKEYMIGAIKATIYCYYQIPKSMPKYKRKLVEEGKLHPMVKPDLDNVAKALLDALNGICYKDDSQIVELEISKHYSDDPMVILELLEIE